MPEYLAPGVYIEETSYRAKSIEGVSTSTAGFVGPTRSGPSTGKPEVLTSFADFQRTYGGLEDLTLGGEPVTNYLAHAARGFFDEAGARLYVMRVIGEGAAASALDVDELHLAAREVGAAGDMEVSFGLTVGRNVLTATDDGPTLTRVRNHDSVLTLDGGGFTVSSADRAVDGTWTLTAADGTETGLDAVSAVYPMSVTVDVARPTVDSRGIATFGMPTTYGPFSLSPDAPDGVWTTFGEVARPEAPPLVITANDDDPKVDTLVNALWPEPSPPDPEWWLNAPSMIGEVPDPPPVSVRHLDGGSDGAAPSATQYAGDAEAVTGLAAFEALEDISIVAAPGSTELDEAEAKGIRQNLLIHCERMRYRVAVLDVPEGRSVNGARAWRNEITSTRAALYYPWLAVTDPFVGGELLLPPSGHVAGIWARNDIRRAVFKAPANEVVLSAIDLERRLTKGQQDVLNPEGVNCLRFFAGRGNLVWGARTVSDDPEWKYVSVRRYMAYLERSIERGTQWAVFEPNGDALWANVRRTVEDFLVGEWKSGALLGRNSKEAFFVRCDRTTMVQTDLDNGRLVCLIGVAIVKPAEFVIFRIGQWTATAPA
jgi:phage tail sheath protein FI